MQQIWMVSNKWLKLAKLCTSSKVIINDRSEGPSSGSTPDRCYIPSRKNLIRRLLFVFVVAYPSD